jgi:hypothetical protein
MTNPNGRKIDEDISSVWKEDDWFGWGSYSGADIADVKILSKKIMGFSTLEKKFGKFFSKSLKLKFPPDKKFFVIEFEPLEVNFNDDENDDENDENKMSEIFIDKNKKLTRGEIKKYYYRPDVRKKIMNRIKNRPVMIYIGIGKNKNILKRNHNGKNIIITNSDLDKKNNPNNYYYWVDKRIIS